MLPPARVRHSVLLNRTSPIVSQAFRVSGTAAVRTGLANNQPRRSFWGRRQHDWTSHLDPMYHRFCRIRTLKTRAKLLRKLQRRGKFEWEGRDAEFFTPKHVRWATRWDGPGGRRPWWIYQNEDNSSNEVNGGDISGGGKQSKGPEDGYELSQREKIWKEQMDRMRKRIESDPYEAIFGKRFEPFWGPLVPSWMREEMGLPVWKAKGTGSADSSKQPNTDSKKEHIKKAESTPKAHSSTTDASQSTEAKTTPAAKVEPKSPQTNSYAYASSTSWDSWSNKTRRVEWDSVSDQTKKYEYDPISNRMVLVEAPAEAGKAKAAGVATKQQNSEVKNRAVSIPVKQSTEVRKSIPIPPPLSQPSHSTPIGFSTTMTTSVGPWKTTAIASGVPKSTAVATGIPKPSTLTNMVAREQLKETAKQDDGLESLTADDVRANMGRPRIQTTGRVESNNTKSSMKTQVDALLSERHINRDLPIRNQRNEAAVAQESEWDKAELHVFYDKELESLCKKKEKLLKDEKGLFHIERQKRELMKLDTRIKEVNARLDRLNNNTTTSSKDRAPTGLQSSLDRMQSKSSSRLMIESEDADDAAAHESTEPIESALSGSVPKEWANQADLLQAERVRRSAIAKGLSPPAPTPGAPQSPVSSITPAEIAARKKVNEARRAAEEAKAAEELAKIKAEKARVQREKKLERANAMLEAEIKEQKLRMQSHEDRYAHKIRALRTELDIAYKQSAVHGEKHVERIKDLQAELEKAQRAIGDKSKVGVEASQAEGDLARGVTNWYKDLSEKMEAGRKKQLQKLAEQHKNDRQLVKEIRRIYERKYGPIDAQHRQPEPLKKPVKRGVVEVESDVDLGEALAKYEKEHDVAYDSKSLKDGLDKELQVRQRQGQEGAKIVDDKMPRLIPMEMSKDSKKAEVTGVKWAEPPLYKVLAYDSGNDMMSTATTTANFTSTEQPISVSEALSQLYAPARFVGSFATLQKDGYQVIYGTKDMLVFRKVADPTPAKVEPAAPALEDHGLVAGQNHPDHWTNWPSFIPKESEVSKETSSNSINPVDGTSSNPLWNGTAAANKITEQMSSKSDLPDESHNVFDNETDWRHYPRVKREEYPVFTGTRRKWREEAETRRTTKAQRKAARKEERRERRRRRGAVWKYVLGTGFAGAGLAYTVGALAEKSRADDAGKRGLEKVERAKGENTS